MNQKKRLVVKDLGMPSKRRSTWGEERATKLFKMRNSGATMKEIYAAFPDKTEKLVKNKVHMMGFSALDK